MRILYAAGPGDVIGTYRYWREGQEDPRTTHVTYSGQFYDLCRELDAEAYVIASCEKLGKVREGRFRIEHRRIPLRGRSGVVFHLGQFWYVLRLALSALRFRANVAVIGGNISHWFALAPLRRLGVHIVPALHCVLWRKHGQDADAAAGRGSRLIRRLNRRFFRSACPAIMTASSDIGEQVRLMTRGRHRSMVEFLPTYRRELFAGVREPEPEKSPWRVFFAGRIERNKGVSDLLEIAKRFYHENERGIVFDLCGSGSALSQLRTEACQAGVETAFQCHGQCDQPKMLELLGQSHLVVVPTRTDFVEGFNQVVVEGILAGRPVVSSSVCPAVAYVREAVFEVAPDDVRAYGDAILRLRDDRRLYEERRRACLALQSQFYDEGRSWKAALRGILVAIQQGRDPEPVSWLRGSAEVTTCAGRF